MKWKEKIIVSCSTFRATGVKYSLLATLLTTMCIGPAIADDSEVFFGKVKRSSKTNPNVLFILDTSWSMSYTDPDEGYPDQRIERMKEAMGVILNSATNVNMGLMRMNGRDEGGAVVYPIVDIDEKICESGTCGEIHVSSRIKTGNDDIEEKNSGSIDLDSNTLNISGRNDYDNHMVALRFQDVKVPTGATITSATIEFVSEDDRDSETLVWLRAENSDNAAPFENTGGTASSRPGTSVITWRPDADLHRSRSGKPHRLVWWKCHEFSHGWQ